VIKKDPNLYHHIREFDNDIQAHNTLSSNRHSQVLFVDLDGTLLTTDLLHEALMTLFKLSPMLFLKVSLKLLLSRAAFKREISKIITPEIHQLPFRNEVLNFIDEQRIRGCKVVLATATDSFWAKKIANGLRIFDGILCSEGNHNLKGTAKLVAIRAYCTENGYTEFDYIGDSFADIPIWREANRVYLVSPSRRLLRKVNEFCKPAAIIVTNKSTINSALSAMRPQQWIKNLLVFVPLITSHRVFEYQIAILCTIAFACFCLCSGAVYIINDLADIKSDRCHPVKKTRPFASGTLPISSGLAIAAGLLVASFSSALIILPASFYFVLTVYFITTFAYSFYFKRIAMLDVLILAGLYTLRIVAGGKAAEILVSEWLMAFSLFLFVSLAFVKRYAELERLLREEEKKTSGRGYFVIDIGLIESLGPASGYIAVLVLALYINSDGVKTLYRNPWVLWLICPMLMYWIGRIWIKAKRGELPEDPVVFALRDRVSIYCGIVTVILLFASSLI
jgi:4-hydroxybenzoate polyprenyltransferase